MLIDARLLCLGVLILMPIALTLLNNMPLNSIHLPRSTQLQEIVPAVTDNVAGLLGGVSPIDVCTTGVDIYQNHREHGHHRQHASKNLNEANRENAPSTTSFKA
jgi:hypothetical protein